MLKRCFVMFLLCATLCSLTSCGVIPIADYIIPETLTITEDSILAENDLFSLQWDSERCCVQLFNRTDDYVWSTTPYEAYQEENSSVYLNSMLFVDYFNTSDNAVTTERSYLAVEDGTVSAEKIENGIIITHYFRELEFTIPIRLTLADDYLDVTLCAEEIVESGKNKILSISLVPNFCSVPNADNQSSFLFVPTGSGALMYTDEEVANSERRYSGETYGTDAGRLRLDVVEEEEKITMPFFAAKAEDDHALLAIIDEGAEASRIEAIAGNRRYGHSQVYSTFIIRGYDEIEQMVANVNTDAKAMADTWAENATYSVHYYPLQGKEADLNGMATRCRQWMTDKELLAKQESVQMPYQVELVGGAQKTTYILGVPVTSTVALTTFEEAQTLLKELRENVLVSPNVLLSGFGTSGADIGKVAGGYRFGNVFGSSGQQKALELYCLDNDIPLFTDFEFVYFSKNGSGFNTLLDTAKTANSQLAVAYPLLKNIYAPNENADKVRLLKRSNLMDVMNKLLKSMGNKVSGISLGSLGNIAYSDYSSRDTYMKQGIGEQVRELIAKAQGENHKVSLRGGHIYAGGVVDSVSDLPLGNGEYRSFDEAVPFYSMLLHGYVPLYSQPINTGSSEKELLLRAIEYGISPTFLLTARDDLALSASQADELFATEFTGQKDVVINAVKESASFFQATAEATIVAYEQLSKGLSKTVYSNGIVVYVNHTDKEVDIDGLTISAQSWLMP